MTLSIFQLFILIIILILFFGDIQYLKKNINTMLNYFYKNKNSILKKKKVSGKKGFEPLNYGFGNRCSTY